MQRRSFLGVTALVCGAIAGCTGQDTDSQSSLQSSQTVTQSSPADSAKTLTPVKNPDSVGPRIELVRIISEWTDYGDTLENAIESVEQGTSFSVAWREHTQVHEGVFHTTSQAEIFDKSGNRVGFNSNVDKQLTDGDGWESWEGFLYFTADWNPGTYSAEVRVRDEVTGLTSDPVSAEFDVIKPIQHLEIISHQQFQDEYSVGVKGIAENTGNETLDYAEVRVKFFDSDGNQLDANYTNTTDLEPGAKWKWEVDYYGDDDFTTYDLIIEESIY